MTDWVASLVVLLVPLVFLLVLLGLLFRELRAGYRPVRLYLRGDYVEARRANARWSLSKSLPAGRHSSQMLEASCLLMEGRVEESLARALELPRDQGDPKLRYATETLIAAGRVLLGRDPNEVVEAMRAVEERLRSEDHLFVAHAALALGDRSGAEAAFSRAVDDEPAPTVELGWRTMLVYDREGDAIARSALRGWFLLKTDRPSEAREELLRATQTTRDNVYVRLARDLLGDDAPIAEAREESPSLVAVEAPTRTD